MAIQMFIDEPTESTLHRAEFSLSGWVAFGASESSSITFHTVHKRLRSELIERPDVRKTLPDRRVVGFHVRISVRDHLSSLSGSTLCVYVCRNNSVVGFLKFTFARSVVSTSMETALLG